MSFVREMTHGGDWYPTDATLEQMLKASFYYAPVNDDEKQRLVGIISPHSCYSVCLKTAAKSYARVDPDSYDRVVILGTCHHRALAACLVSDATECVTPFGNLEVDVDECKKLCEDTPDMFAKMTEAEDNAEHSLEMQYPLLKWVFRDRPLKIIPILVGSLSEEREAKIVPIIRDLVTRERTLFVISTDFTHWGEIFKFTGFANMRKPLSAQVPLFDEKAMNIISGFNYDHFRFHIEEVSGSICGCYAICLMLHVLRRGYSVQQFDRSELCQVLCPTDFSISYIAAGFYAKPEGEAEEEEPDGLDEGMIEAIGGFAANVPYPI